MKLHMDTVRIPVIVWRFTLAAALSVIMHLATTQMDYPGLEDINDKVSHILAFYVLSLLADFSFPNSGFGSSKALSLLAYGLSVEIIQYFIPYRSFSVLDLAADGAGMALYSLSLPVLKYLPLLRSRWRV